MSQQREHWEEEYERAKKRDADFETISGVPVKPLYDPSDADGIDVEKDIGTPGHFPYTRGIYTSGYRGRLWTIRQFSGFGAVRQTNERYRMLLASGGTGLSVAFDMPTLMGRDSDDPRSEGEVGHCGVAVDSVADMDQLFADIPLADVTTSMTISGPAVVVRLRRACRLHRRDRETRRRPADLGALDARAVRRDQQESGDAEVPHPDGRRVPHHAAAVQQRRQHGDRGAGRGARRDAVAA